MTKQRAAWRRWYYKNKDKKMAWQNKRRAELKTWMKNLKAALSCKKCGENHPGCLQFHHADPSKKEISISQAVTINWSTKRILKEIEKCVVLCANCHIKLHYRQKQKQIAARSRSLLGS